ncbi:hypothetical protein [Halogeometricum rufum]|nr:hypothetical protein [Halogeometricum rufum]
MNLEEFIETRGSEEGGETFQLHFGGESGFVVLQPYEEFQPGQ